MLVFEITQRKQHFPRLYAQVIEELELPISEEELGKIIAGLLSGKSPGPDGFTNQNFKKFAQVLLGPMCCQFTLIKPGLYWAERPVIIQSGLSTIYFGQSLAQTGPLFYFYHLMLRTHLTG